MKTIMFAIFIVTSANSFATAAPPKTADWAVFKNNYEYKLRYPSCWRVTTGFLPDRRPLTEQNEIVSVEKPAGCIGVKMQTYPNPGISFSVVDNQKKTAEETAKDIKHLESSLKMFVVLGDYLISKRFQNKGNEELGWVESMKGVGHITLRWNFQLYCKNYWIHASGALIEDPNKTLLDKLKAGDFALPESQKTIIDSFECVDPK